MLDSVFRIVALVRKELLAMFKDPRERAVLFVPPALQCLLFGYVATFDLNRVSYAAFDRDRSAASYEFFASLDGSGVFQRVANLDRAADVKTMIDEQRVLLVVQIDQDFERRLLSGQAADVQVIADGRNSNTARTAMNYVGTVVDAFNSQWRAAHAGVGPPIRVTTRAWYNWNLETRWSIVPGLVGTMTLAEILLLTVMSVAREKEQGTFDQLLVTPFVRPKLWPERRCRRCLSDSASPPSFCWSLSCGSIFPSRARSLVCTWALPCSSWQWRELDS